MRKAVLVAVGAVAAAALWWRRNPSACPYSQRFWVEAPHPLITRSRLREALAPRPGERLLEVGPGTGYYALPVAEWLGPDGRLEVFDLQREMLDHTLRRAGEAGLTTLVPTQGDARSLPYPDDAVDGAYLVTVLGEIPDQEKALSKLLTASLPGTRVADLAWSRLTRSRELIAQSVNSEDLLHSLRQVDVVRVRARGPKPDVPARYFAAWLSNRLALAGAFPKLEWDFTPMNVPPSLRGVSITGPDGFSLSAEIKQSVTNGVVVDLTVNGRVNCAVLLRPSEYESLLQELSIPGRDVIYEAALRRAATVM